MINPERGPGRWYNPPSMKVTRRFARRFRLLEVLRGALGLGGLLDLTVAVLVVVSPAALAKLAGIPLEAVRAEAHLPWLLAALLLPLGTLYFVAARDPRRYSGIIVVAIGGRLLGAAALGAGAVHRPELGGLWVLAGANLALAVLIAGSWIPLRA